MEGWVGQAPERVVFPKGGLTMYPPNYRTGDEYDSPCEEYGCGFASHDPRCPHYQPPKPPPTPEEIAAEGEEVVPCLVCQRPTKFKELRDTAMCPKCHLHRPATSRSILFRFLAEQGALLAHDIYDDALVGCFERSPGNIVALYDRQKCIRVLTTHGMNEEQAENLFQSYVASVGKQGGRAPYFTELVD